MTTISGASGGTDATIGTSSGYEATIRRTTHGVAHVVASNLGNLGFGQGYACAADHLATICDQVVKATSRRSRFFGAGPADAHLHSDLGYLALGVRRHGEHMAATQPDEIIELVTGYAAGVTAWWDQHGPDALPNWCSDAPWVGPLSPTDLFTLYADMAIMASGRNLAPWIGSARPPGTPVPEGHLGEATPPPEPAAPGGPPPTPASNGWALGREATTFGGGLVVANPHFPFYGDGRFWECHLTVPGELDVYGVSLIGTPGVQIGFTETVGWTHTFSRGNRFCLYRLHLTGSATSYRYGDSTRDLTPTEHTVEVLDHDGVVRPRTRTLWSSHHGPVVDVPLLGWSDTEAYALRDANLGNDRMLAQYLAMDRATNVGSLRATIRTQQGLPWVNVMAADSTGEVYYSDPSTTPALTPDTETAYETAVAEDFLTAVFHSQRVALLDGSDPRSEWVTRPGAAGKGLAGPDDLPEWMGDTVVFNSNDPYWIPHPTEHLDRGPVLAGLWGKPLSPRTRANALALSDALEHRWDAHDAVEHLLSNRCVTADLLLDQVTQRLEAAGAVTIGGERFDLTDAGRVLRSWDRCYNADSVGAILWREFIGSFTDDDIRNGSNLWARPFSVTDPVHTPAGLAPPPTSGADPVLVSMGQAISALRLAGIPIDAPLGDHQWVDRCNERIPLHGAGDAEGVLNVVTPVTTLVTSSLEPQPDRPEPIAGRVERTGLHRGGYPITYGASFVMVVRFGPDGPQGDGLLVYGQSDDPDSPHHIDQLREFAAKRLRPLLFREADIRADPAFSETVVRSDPK